MDKLEVVLFDLLGIFSFERVSRVGLGCGVSHFGSLGVRHNRETSPIVNHRHVFKAVALGGYVALK